MDVDLASVAALIADPSRAAMLDALLNGGRHSARELAVAAGIAPSTATEHLHRLEQGGLVVTERVGRRREVRLAGPDVGRALESLAALAPVRRPVGLREWNHGEALRAARSCYDHLAGQAGVALADGLTNEGILTLGDGAFGLTDDGHARLSAFGLDIDAILGARRATARACVDWSERRPHIGGALGAALLSELLHRNWLQPAPVRTGAKSTRGRVLRITPAGHTGLHTHLGVAL
ncbi:ArsR/SmtB family transcription factor [Conexibacter woesei]|uniref:ArsR/SmtB family transcription factor n=1 Tax=Conexibacter woesei TaxID=191495 RepID=UPI00040DEA42|nr:helix-turn-helix transcriptional regulator [Conexibacter woesei]